MSGVQELHLFEIKAKVSATQKRYYTTVLHTSRYYTLRAVEKTPNWLQSAAPATKKRTTRSGLWKNGDFGPRWSIAPDPTTRSARPNFRCILQHFHGVVSQPRDTTRSALWKKRLTGFKVLRLPRKNVLHAPGCDKMAILDHGEVLPQTLLHARRCGKTQILQDFELPHSKEFY